MKIRNWSITIILLSLFAVFSCKKDQKMVDREIGDILILSTNSVTLDDSGASKMVRVTTNLESYEVVPSDSWISFKKSKDTLLVGAEANEGAGRVGSVEITAGSITEVVKVTQEVATTTAAGITVEGIEFIKVDGGTFMMGSQNTDPNAPNYGVGTVGSSYNANQSPVHEVTLSDYYIGKFQITQSQWQAVMGSNPSKNVGSDKGDYPVEYVDYSMAQAFVEKLSLQTGKTFRLPTEAEWEYAARGGNKSLGYLYSGSDDPYEVGNFSKNSNDRDTHATTEVGSFKPNELGIYDMCGNVYEWCSDHYGTYPSTAQVNPTGPTTGSKYVARGASWWHYATTVYYRGNATPDYTGSSPNAGLTGLRIVYVPEGLTKTVEGIDFVKVDGGTFMMGSQNTDPNAPNYGIGTVGSSYNANQSPVHEVTLTGFYIGKYQITQSQWEAVMGSNPSKNTGTDKGNYPVEYVDYTMAQAFVEKLSLQTGKTFRLPTEAEWEYAARGGNKSLGYLYSGSDDPYEVGNFSKNTNDRDTHATTEVGSFKPNELGIYDMSGNVYEWCSDYYGTYPSTAQTDPTGPSSGTKRVARGASWWHYATTVYYRGNATEDYTGTSPNAGLTGLRIVYVP